MADKTITARFPEDLAAALEAVAIIEKRNVSAILREAAEAYIVDQVDLDKVMTKLKAASEETRRQEEVRMKLVESKVADLGQRPKRPSKKRVLAGGAGETPDSDGDD